ncbi:MAG: DUF7467 domain-containing protein [Planctomycetota bacterium]|jgi:hypothetical protein
MRALTTLGVLVVLTGTANAGDCCEDGTPPRLLRMIYLATGCDATSHQQDPDKVICATFVDALPDDVYVIVSNKMDPVTEPARIWFEGNVGFGDVIDVDAITGDSIELRNRTCIAIFAGEGAALLQQVEFRTSCMQPLRSGDQFGAFLLVECFAGPPPEDCCESGRPGVLTMRYTAEDCTATGHDQETSKVICQDFEPLPNLVYVLATNRADPDDPRARVWFEGFVGVGQTFEIDAENDGLTELRNRTYLYAYDQPHGELLQVAGFCTSCNEPLFGGDQFGGFSLVGCEVFVGGEGCSQGYWKQPHHFDSWPDEYSPSTPFSDVFEDAFPGMTLVQVLRQGGGKLKALGRKTVAALLNASSPDVAYDLSADQVIDMFNDVYPAGHQTYNELKDEFEDFNKQDCPLN